MNRGTPSLIRGSAVVLVSMILAGLLALAISVSIARSVGVSDFGVYSMVVSVQNVFGLFAGFSIGTATAKFVSEYRVCNADQASELAKTGLMLVLILSLITAGTYSLLSGVIGDGLYHEPLITPLIPFSALVVISSALLSVSLGIVQGCQRIKLLAFMQVLSPFLSILAVTVLLKSVGMRGIFIGFFLGQSVAALTGLALLRRREFFFHSFPLKLRGSGSLKTILSFSLPAFLGSIVVLPVFWVGNTELTLTSGFEVMGYFAVSMVVFSSMMILPNAIAIPLVPRISELTVNWREAIGKLISQSVRMASLLLFPLMFGVALFSEYIVAFLYGQTYKSSVVPVYLMVTACYFYALGSIVGALVVGVGRMWVGLGLNIVWACSFLLIVFMIVPVWGATGLAAAYALSYGVLLVTSFVVSKRVLGADLSSAYAASAFAAILFAIGYLLVSDRLEVGVAGIAVLFVVAAGLSIWFGRAGLSLVFKRLTYR
jgi:O-antigen/teichoic acid export membrane protein